MPFLAPLAALIVPKLARHGLDILQSVVRRGTEQSIEKVNDLIQEKTGIDLSNVADDKLSEEDWSKLKDFELQHESVLLEQLRVSTEHNIDRLKLANEDRENARAMQTEAAKSGDWWTRNFVSGYAVLITLATFAFFAIVLGTDWVFSYDTNADGMLVLDPASQSKERIVDTVMGFLLGVSLSAIIQFYFGSSAGSSRKTDTIEGLLKQNAED